jgi:Xaa-Pro aminopeptidase
LKSDLDRLMEEAGLDALLVIGRGDHNPSLCYFTGSINLTHGYVLKRRGQLPVLFHGSMEREEAAGTGMQTKNLDDYDYAALLQQAGGDRNLASALRMARIFQDFGVQGRLALYGHFEVGPAYGLFRRLEQQVSGLEIVPEQSNRAALVQARATKDADEVERIRQMGKSTVAVAADVAGYLTSHRIRDGMLVNREDEVLTIGEVKRRINLWLAMRGAENPHGTIFAAGRDAGIPHSAGQDEQPVPVGKALIFDLYPCEAGGGYFYDFTRTWAVGHASDELQQLHQDVLETYRAVFPRLQADSACREYQVMACQQFQSRGHTTVMQDLQTETGYVHSLGHGLGLEVHESPNFTHLEINQDRLLPGMVFTFEPGLYYPDREMGVRVEDTVWARPDGGFEVLADFPTDLVLKVPGG